MSRAKKCPSGSFGFKSGDYLPNSNFELFTAGWIYLTSDAFQIGLDTGTEARDTCFDILFIGVGKIKPHAV